MQVIVSEAVCAVVIRYCKMKLFREDLHVNKQPPHPDLRQTANLT